MKKYSIKPTKKQLEVMKDYWKRLRDELEQISLKIGFLELEMQKETKIDDLEFFMCDNEYVGIGNSNRTMKLLQREELEKEKK